MTDLTDQNFDELVGSNGTAVVEFGGEFCGPCHHVRGQLECIERNCIGVRFGFVDVQDNVRVASRFSISSIPVVMVFKDGRVQSCIRGRSKNWGERVISAIQAG